MQGDTNDEPERVGDRRVKRPRQRIPLGRQAYIALHEEAVRQDAVESFEAQYEESEPEGTKLKPAVYTNRAARRAAKRLKR